MSKESLAIFRAVYRIRKEASPSGLCTKSIIACNIRIIANFFMNAHISQNVQKSLLSLKAHLEQIAENIYCVYIFRVIQFVQKEFLN